MQKILYKILMAPFSLLYGLGVLLRNMMYKYGLMKGVEFSLPVISVGNLTVGGAGKTPHIEYLIRELHEYIEVSTLSRGYKRKTKGFLEVLAGADANSVGDEPLQFKRKFPDIMVAVGENRMLAIPQMVMQRPDLQLILLDDAFQHRAVTPGLNILLTEYNKPFTRDLLLPSGRLREWPSAYKRADLIIISKCPNELEPGDRARFTEELKLYDHQRLYFSYYKYLDPYFIFDPVLELRLTKEVDILLISAIAGTKYLKRYLSKTAGRIHVLEYEDHHYFNGMDIEQMVKSFERIESENKIILTTEKDAMRLELHKEYLVEKKLPIYALPIEVNFHQNGKEKFDEDIRTFLMGFKS